MSPRAATRLAALAILAALLVVVLRARPAPVAPVARASGGLLIVLAEGDLTGGGGPRMDVGEAALAPGRDWWDAVTAGERRPTPDAPRLGDALRRAGIRTVASGAAASRLLGTPSVDTDPTRLVGPGVCVAVDRPGWFAAPAEPDVAVLVLPARVGPDERFVPVLLVAPGASGRPSSPSTRVPGFVAATDLPATIAALCGVEARVGAGRPLGWIADDPGGLERRAMAWRRHDALLEARWVVPVGMAALLAGGLLLRRERLCALAAALPMGLLIAPLAAWGLAGATAVVGGYGGAFLGTLWTKTPAVYLLAALLAWGVAGEGRLTAIAALTALVCAGDAVSGFGLQTRSPLGYGLAEGSRYFGVGNETAGAWIGAALCVAVRWDRATGAALLAGAALAIGAPSLGANAGCGISAAVGLVALGVAAVPARRRWWVAGAGVLALGLAVGAVAWRDASRPASSRSHVGEAVASARDAGGGALGRIVARKVGTNARLLVGSPWALLLGVEAAALWAHRRRLGGRGPLLAGLGAALALNDSGVVAAALGGVFATPETRNAAGETPAAQG